MWWLIFILPVWWYWRTIRFYTNPDLLRAWWKSRSQLPLFQVKTLRRSYHIQYGDRPYHLMVPYNHRLIVRSADRRVYLIHENGEIDITQQPGIPYSFTAEQLGGIGYRVTNNEDTTTYGPQDFITF